jgi:hypothetical protein
VLGTVSKSKNNGVDPQAGGHLGADARCSLCSRRHPNRRWNGRTRSATRRALKHWAIYRGRWRGHPVAPENQRGPGCAGSPDPVRFPHGRRRVQSATAVAGYNTVNQYPAATPVDERWPRRETDDYDLIADSAASVTSLASTRLRRRYCRSALATAALSGNAGNRCQVNRKVRAGSCETMPPGRGARVALADSNVQRFVGGKAVRNSLSSWKLVM